MKKALITGITGQDGAYMANFFSIKGMKFTVSNVEVHFSIPIE